MQGDFQRTVKGIQSSGCFVSLGNSLKSFWKGLAMLLLYSMCSLRLFNLWSYKRSDFMFLPVAPCRLPSRNTRWNTRAKGRVWRSARLNWRNCAGRARAARTPPSMERRRCRWDSCWFFCTEPIITLRLRIMQWPFFWSLVKLIDLKNINGALIPFQCPRKPSCSIPGSNGIQPSFESLITLVCCNASNGGKYWEITKHKTEII